MTLEEIAKNFGEEVAVHLTDATDEEKAQLDRQLVESGGVDATAQAVEKDTNESSPVDGTEQNPPKV